MPDDKIKISKEEIDAIYDVTDDTKKVEKDEKKGKDNDYETTIEEEDEKLEQEFDLEW